jgi:hypothetical protein
MQGQLCKYIKELSLEARRGKKEAHGPAWVLLEAEKQWAWEATEAACGHVRNFCRHAVGSRWLDTWLLFTACMWGGMMDTVCTEFFSPRAWLTYLSPSTSLIAAQVKKHTSPSIVVVGSPSVHPTVDVGIHLDRRAFHGMFGPSKGGSPWIPVNRHWRAMWSVGLDSDASKGL